MDLCRGAGTDRLRRGRGTTDSANAAAYTGPFRTGSPLAYTYPLSMAVTDYIKTEKSLR